MKDEYLQSWMKFRIQCEAKAKGRAKLTNDCWRKLIAFHLDKYLKSHENPYLFLFTMKFEHSQYFREHRMSSKYYYYARKRFESLNPLIHGTFHFPSYKK